MITNGIDLVEISRIEKSLENPKFRQRVYGKHEIAELEIRHNPVESYAGAFAAKEAFSKALGTGVSGFSWCEVEVLHDDSGRPYFSLSGVAQEIAEKRKLAFSLSITHTAQYAAAIVTAFSEE